MKKSKPPRNLPKLLPLRIWKKSFEICRKIYLNSEIIIITVLSISRSTITGASNHPTVVMIRPYSTFVCQRQTLMWKRTTHLIVMWYAVYFKKNIREHMTGRNLQKKVLKSVGRFIWIVKGQNNFWSRIGQNNFWSRIGQNNFWNRIGQNNFWSRMLFTYSWRIIGSNELEQ